MRSEATEKRELLEQEHLSLSTRKMVAVQNADQVKIFKNFWASGCKRIRIVAVVNLPLGV